MRIFSYGWETIGGLEKLGFVVSKASPGILEDYRLAFNRISEENDYTGIANIVFARGCRLEGIVYSLEGGNPGVLDRFEGYPDFACKGTAPVKSCGQVVNCTVYWTPCRRDICGLLPSRNYLGSLAAWADLLSPGYREFLSLWPAAEDNKTGLKAVIFDWGNTLMKDFNLPGPMAEWPAVEAIFGINETLEKLGYKYVLAVASNAGSSDAALLRKALARVELDHYFSYIFTSRELGCEKPDPAFFVKILRRMNLMPGQCAMVGDDYNKDVRAARDVGLNAVLYAPSGHSYCRTITNCAELPGILQDF